MILSVIKAYVTVSLVIYVYDYVLTVGSEVSLVWDLDHKKTLVDILYFVARYTPLPALILSAARGTTYITIYPLPLTLTMIIQAPYIHSILIQNCPVNIELTATSRLRNHCGKIADSCRRGSCRNYPPHAIAILATMQTPYGGVLSLVLLVMNEFIVICLTLIRYFRIPEESEVAKTLLRDSIFYFLCILMTSVINLWATLVSSDENGIPEFQLVIHSVLSTRIVRNLREKKPDLNS